MQQSLYHAAVTVVVPALLELRITNRICSGQSNIHVGNQWKSVTECFWPFGHKNRNQIVHAHAELSVLSCMLDLQERTLYRV